ncbi:threonine--tRNA ligase, partial [Sulfolobus sp. SCGC AB-777_G06]
EGIPYIVIVGKKEMEKGEITVRARGNLEIRGIKLNNFLSALLEEIKNRDLSQNNTLSKLK